MKKTLLLAIVILVTSLFFSCKKDEEEIPDTPTNTTPTYTQPNNYFSGKINGSSFSSVSNILHQTSQIEFTATMGTSALTMYIMDSLSGGYSDHMGDGKPTDAGYVASFYPFDYYSTESPSGNIAIASHDTTHKWIEGTFYCTLTSSSSSTVYTVTDGEFGVTYDSY